MKNIRKAWMAVLAAAAGLIGVGGASTAQAQQPPNVSIASVDLRGRLCRDPGQSEVDLVAGNTAFIIKFNEFNVAAGPGIPLTDKTKSCTAIVALNYPARWTWAISDIAYHGSMTLENYNVLGRFSARLSFPGTRTVSREVRRSGPFFGDFDLTTHYDDLVWAPCRPGVPMTILMTAGLDNLRDRRREGAVNVSQSDGTFQARCHIRWRRCG